jgi:hypothetical protein
MTPGTLSPASVVIDYHSIYGAHKMTIPTLEWFAVGFVGALGGYAAWNATARDAETMVNELVDKIKVFHLSTTHFDQATIYQQATPTSENIPRASVALTQVGAKGASNFAAAFSTTFNFKTSDNNDFRLVLLDAPLGTGGMASIFPADFDADVLAVETAVTVVSNAWAGRDDTHVNTLRKVTFDLNDSLQKKYYR